ncbi:MAG: Holliday junction branch migration protein RuvA [Acidimicrobiia bacterium]|nr:MAG: Holliday junction branch migration protein RuvA [Acidimicrobiia bacterium]
MIGRLRGLVAGRHGEGALIEVDGVGYEVAMPGRDLALLPAVGEEAVVHTHLHVREDVMALYGFAGEDGRNLFRLLIATSGVGPKLALAILGVLPPERLRAAVLAEDVDALTQVPGIGTRSAQKLVLDLRARLALPAGDIPGPGGMAEVRRALEGLGYDASEIREAIDGLEGDDPQALLKSALQRLGRR